MTTLAPEVARTFETGNIDIIELLFVISSTKCISINHHFYGQQFEYLVRCLCEI